MGNMEDFLSSLQSGAKAGPQPPGPITLDSLLEIINTVDEQTQNALSGFSSDLTGLLVNLLAAINLMVAKGLMTEAEFEEQVALTATKFRNQQLAQDQAEASPDSLDDIIV